VLEKPCKQETDRFARGQAGWENIFTLYHENPLFQKEYSWTRDGTGIDILFDMIDQAGI